MSIIRGQSPGGRISVWGLDSKDVCKANNVLNANWKCLQDVLLQFLNDNFYGSIFSAKRNV